MVESDEDFSEEEAQDPDSKRRNEKKKQMIMAIALVVAIFLFSGVAYYFLSGSGVASEEGGERDEEGRRAGLRPPKLTGHGIVLSKEIPDLPPIPYPRQGGEKEAAMADSSGMIQGEKSVRLASGEVVYTLGDSEQTGTLQTAAGVVLIDQVKVQEGDNRERLLQARIHNLGSQYLSDVTLNIRFLSRTGQSVLERAINPLVISGGLFGDKVQTLSPGTSRLFVIDGTEVPGEWSGEISAQVVHYRFAP
ncbi:MAG: hypothetical protein HQL67_01290 [Magnetococcales bacterium]|nr:hypothetical protein [Magnetococcales bacterium]